jgi:hypothetical protein
VVQVHDSNFRGSWGTHLILQADGRRKGHALACIQSCRPFALQRRLLDDQKIVSFMGEFPRMYSQWRLCASTSTWFVGSKVRAIVLLVKSAKQMLRWNAFEVIAPAQHVLGAQRHVAFSPAAVPLDQDAGNNDEEDEGECNSKTNQDDEADGEMFDCESKLI